MEEFIEYKTTRYFVSKSGKVIGRWGRELKGRPFWRGKYLAVKIDTTNVLIHRMIAETFIPNPNNLRDVNHKDGNIYNNSVENLEWLSHSDNMKHSYKELGRVSPFTGKFYRKFKPGWLLGKTGDKSPKARKVDMYDLQHNYLKSFSTINDAAKYVGVSHVSIVKVCKEQTKKCKNYIFKYAK